MPTEYAELHCLSNFTFLRGASHAEELVMRAYELGYRALAITDECSVAGVVRAHTAAKKYDFSIIVGSEFRLACGLRFVALAVDRASYGRLCRLITRGRRSAEKGQYCLTRNDVEEILQGCLILWLPASRPKLDEIEWLNQRFRGTLWVAVELLLDGTDEVALERLQSIGRKLDLPLVASGDVHMHVRARRPLQDALTAVRHGVPLAEAGMHLYPNGERYLRERQRLAKFYAPELLNETVRVAERCTFKLDELRYEYPREVVPDGETPTSYLRRITEAGALRRWPQGVPPAIQEKIEYELKLIADLKYEPYFLTVYDIVVFARGKKILCQGRGSAANSVVCYCLGVTEVDPARQATLVERFISRERNEPPDIDIDFEHERREEVIQYVYGKYGRDRAALAAVVISYRSRSALRDMAKTMGLDGDQAARMAGAMQWWDGTVIAPERIREAGFDATQPEVAWTLRLAAELLRFPRHLSQHPGGFVISQGPLEELVPIENAAMPGRTVIQWDKDDLDDLGLIKVDVLGLGMLSAIRRALDLVSAYRGHPMAICDVPAEDPKVYDMICKADTVGVFQIESRAQMSMLPRLKPRKFFDLVIEVAIVRPGPIQGDMVHPYLRRRDQLEPVTYPSDEVRAVLECTLGVPLFQEQVMALAMAAAGFSAGEADQLRRAMAAWKKRGGLGSFEDKLLRGMLTRGYSQEFAQRIFAQILGFGEYGFPMSHSASFALLVYVSAWLKCHEPAAFTCALLNSLPMGFYAPAQLVRDVRAHGVEVLPVDVGHSGYESSLERGRFGEAALRLGMRLVNGLSEAGARRVEAARRQAPFTSVQDVTERAGLNRHDLEALAAASALVSLTGNRHLAFWEVAATEKPLPIAPPARTANSTPLLPVPTEGQNLVADYRAVGLTLNRHPMALLRDRLKEKQVLSARELDEVRNGAPVRTAGIVVTRQRPGSASGVTFVTIEDETGSTNLIVWKAVGERYRNALVQSKMLEVAGKLQREGLVMHVIAERLVDRSRLLGSLVTEVRDFH
jgi:error-prone DNA polymerase